MISYTRTHILSTVSSVSCCVVAYVATEPETVFIDDFFTRNLMCSMQAKLPVFGSHLKGKMPANAIALGPRIRTFAKSPQKGPQSDGGCLRTALDVNGYFDAIFWQDFSAFPAISLISSGRPWTS